MEQSPRQHNNPQLAPLTPLLLLWYHWLHTAGSFGPLPHFYSPAPVDASLCFSNDVKGLDNKEVGTRTSCILTKDSFMGRFNLNIIYYIYTYILIQDKNLYHKLLDQTKFQD